MYKIETTNFILEMDYTEKDSNALYVKVLSYDFAASTFFEIDKEDMADFCAQLYNVYINLTGTAYLCEEIDNEDRCIKFSTVTGGRIEISGNIISELGHGYTHRLTFENAVDQTELKDFAINLYSDYRKYI